MTRSRTNRKVVIVGPMARTPIVPMHIPAEAEDVGVAAVLGLFARARELGLNLDPNRVGALYCGQVAQSAFTSDIAWRIAQRAGLPHAHTATKHKQCGSSLDTAKDAFLQVASGEEECIVVVGAESMQRTPLLFEPSVRESWSNRQLRAFSQKPWGRGLQMFGIRKAYGPGFAWGYAESGLATSLNALDPTKANMIQTACNLAGVTGATRAECDHVGWLSHSRASSSRGREMHGRHIVPFFHPQTGLITTDLNVREDVSEASLAGIKALPGTGGLITAGNSSNMGAMGGAIVIMSERLALDLGLPILAEIVDCLSVGVDPHIMGFGPLPASEELLRRLGRLDENGRIREPESIYMEVNEAFGVVPVAFARYFGIPVEMLNPYGGAIALGHPLGATGVRCLQLIAEAVASGSYSLGLFSLCMAGGMGSALAVQPYVNDNAALSRSVRAA